MALATIKNCFACKSENKQMRKRQTPRKMVWPGHPPTSGSATGAASMAYKGSRPHRFPPESNAQSDATSSAGIWHGLPGQIGNVSVLQAVVQPENGRQKVAQLLRKAPVIFLRTRRLTSGKFAWIHFRGPAALSQDDLRKKPTFLNWVEKTLQASKASAKMHMLQ